MATSSEIADRIVAAILARKLAPGCRLGEQPLATLFGCSRTIVREALIRLSVRGIVQVSARRGWYLRETSSAQAEEAFRARFVIETGLLRAAPPLDRGKLARLRAHMAEQRALLNEDTDGRRSFMLGDFHVVLAECLGNALLAETLRDLTICTTLMAVGRQTAQEARQSCTEHATIMSALEAQDMRRAERLMAAHLSTWQEKLLSPVPYDPLAELRQALQPNSAVQHLHTRRRAHSNPTRPVPRTPQ
jgi:DNA-binding GntR family transcriptional regulator